MLSIATALALPVFMLYKSALEHTQPPTSVPKHGYRRDRVKDGSQGRGRVVHLGLLGDDVLVLLLLAAA